MTRAYPKAIPELIQAIKKITIEDCEKKEVIEELTELNILLTDFLSMFKYKPQMMKLK